MNLVRSILDLVRGGLNRGVTELIESQRENVAIGWPQFGVPPLDPLFVENLQIDGLEGFSS